MHLGRRNISYFDIILVLVQVFEDLRAANRSLPEVT
jgi:hypothetical protein